MSGPLLAILSACYRNILLLFFRHLEEGRSRKHRLLPWVECQKCLFPFRSRVIETSSSYAFIEEASIASATSSGFSFYPSLQLRKEGERSFRLFFLECFGSCPASSSASPMPLPSFLLFNRWGGWQWGQKQNSLWMRVCMRLQFFHQTVAIFNFLHFKGQFHPI